MTIVCVVCLGPNFQTFSPSFSATAFSASPIHNVVYRHFKLADLSESKSCDSLSGLALCFTLSFAVCKFLLVVPVYLQTSPTHAFSCRGGLEKMPITLTHSLTF